MGKTWIRYTTFSIIFFIIYLTIVIFYNKPVFINFWQEAILIMSILNLLLAYIYYRHDKDEFAGRRKKVNNQ
jgi:hypothetical protein